MTCAFIPAAAAASATPVGPSPLPRRRPDPRGHRTSPAVRGVDPTPPPPTPPPSGAASGTPGRGEARAGATPSAGADRADRFPPGSPADRPSPPATPLTLEVHELVPGRPLVAPGGAHLVVIPARGVALRARIGRGGAGREVELRPGDAALIPAGAQGAWEPRAPARATLIRVDPEAVRRLAASGLGPPDGGGLGGDGWEDTVVLRDCALGAVASRMEDTLGGGGPGALFEILAPAFLALLLRARAQAGRVGAGERVPVAGLTPAAALRPEQRRALVAFVEANPARRIAVAELAAVAA